MSDTQFIADSIDMIKRIDGQWSNHKRCEVTIEALEKRIPKRAIEKPERFPKEALYCPDCDGCVSHYWVDVKGNVDMVKQAYNYCPHCGQRLEVYV